MKAFYLLRLLLAYWLLPKKAREFLTRLAETSQAINPAWTGEDVLKELERLKP